MKNRRINNAVVKIAVFALALAMIIVSYTIWRRSSGGRNDTTDEISENDTSPLDIYEGYYYVFTDGKILSTHEDAMNYMKETNLGYTMVPDDEMLGITLYDATGLLVNLRQDMVVQLKEDAAETESVQHGENYFVQTAIYDTSGICQKYMIRIRDENGNLAEVEIPAGDCEIISEYRFPEL